MDDVRQRHGVAVQTHLSENKFEIERTLELFPDCSDYTEVYERAGLIGCRSILAHCIHLSDEEMGRLAARKSVSQGYVVEVCPVCRWNHLTESRSIGGS